MPTQQHPLPRYSRVENPPPMRLTESFFIPTTHSELYQSKKNAEVIRQLFLGAPNEVRTRVLALRGPRPGPLDDGGVKRWNSTMLQFSSSTQPDNTFYPHGV